jgi:hypothetical protein
MPTESTAYGRFEELLLAVGLGLVVLGAVVMGFFETILGSAHYTQRVPSHGVVTIHTSFAPHLRASVIALGFLVLFGWSCYRLGRAILT